MILYRFPVDRWLDVGESDKRISLDLEPDKKPGQLKGKYTFWIIREQLEKTWRDLKRELLFLSSFLINNYC